MSRSHPLSLANLMHLLRPLKIVDEAHESFMGCSVRLVDALAARDPRSAARSDQLLLGIAGRGLG